MLKHIGYYISKGKCVKAYSLKKKNRAGKLVTKRVNYKGKSLKKGTRVYKSKTACKKALKRKNKKSPKKNLKKSPKRNHFGKQCYYNVPYFGNYIPSIAKMWSGTSNTGITSSSWRWPHASKIDKQQGGWLKM